MYLFYFDCGTSNTRGYLLRGGRVICSHKKNVGSKDVAVANDNAILLTGLLEIYEKVLRQAGVAQGEIESIYASGMITSPYGLKEVPHMPTPLTASRLKDSIYAYMENCFFHREIRLIRGAKTTDGPVTPEMMEAVCNVRGEETEAFGVLYHLPPEWLAGRHLIVIPGSHTHGILMEGGAITDILSTFSGEMFYALQNATVLRGGTAVSDSVEPDPDAVLLGCEMLKRHGIARAVYVVHGMKIFDVWDNAKRRDTLSGIVTGAAVQSLMIALSGKWKGARNISIYSDDSVLNAYRIAFDCFAPPDQERPLLLSRSKYNCSVEGLLKIIGYEEGK